MERKDIVSSLLLTDISQLKTLVVPTVEKGKRKQVMRWFLYQAILYDIEFSFWFLTYRYISFWLDKKTVFLFCGKAWRFLTCKFYTPLIGTWYMWSNRWNESSQQLNYIMNIYSLLQAKKSLLLKRAGLHKNHRQFRNNIAKNI